jgi:phosphonoacetaldehyde hydrolase
VTRVEAVIFDWAGTTVDHGSLAPVKAVTELFARHLIAVSDSEARRDMGLFKKDHIRRILGMPRVEDEWQRMMGRAPGEGDVESLFAEFADLQMEILGAHAQVIHGVAGVAKRLRGRGVKLGSTTGYTRPMLDFLLGRAAEQGYAPDLSYCPEDVGGGRPHPWMCLRIALEFRLSSMAAAVKVGDTTGDIQEGRNAGMWTVGVSLTGNEVGLSEAELAALPAERRVALEASARECLEAAGAHYVVESVAGLEAVLEEIEGRMEEGDRP